MEIKYYLNGRLAGLFLKKIIIILRIGKLLLINGVELWLVRCNPHNQL